MRVANKYYIILCIFNKIPGCTLLIVFACYQLYYLCVYNDASVRTVVCLSGYHLSVSVSPVRGLLAGLFFLHVSYSSRLHSSCSA